MSDNETPHQQSEQQTPAPSSESPQEQRPSSEQLLQGADRRLEAHISKGGTRDDVPFRGNVVSGNEERSS